MAKRTRCAAALLLLVLVGNSANALAQPTAPAAPTEAVQTLGLGEVLASVDQSFPLLAAARVEIDVAASDLRSAEGGFDASWKTKATLTPIGFYDGLRIESTLERPTAIWGASTFAGWRLGTGKFASYDGKLQTLEYGELRAGVNVPFWRNGPIDRRRATLARAELGQEVARYTVSEQRILYRRAAATRYWTWVAAGKRLEVANDLLRIVVDRDGGIAARVARGDLPAIEQSDNARAIAQRRSQVVLSTRALEQASIELGLYLRDAKGNVLVPNAARLPADFPDLVPAAQPDDTPSALAQRPEAKRLALQVRQQGIEAEYARNQTKLGIDLQVAASQDLGRTIAARPDLTSTVLEVTLMLDVPLETRQFRGRADAAAALGRRLALQQEFANDRIRADVRDAQSALRAAQERIVAAREEIKMAQALEVAERTRFNNGDSTLLIVNLREQQAAEAELREIDARADYMRSVADATAARGE